MEGVSRRNCLERKLQIVLKFRSFAVGGEGSNVKELEISFRGLCYDAQAMQRQMCLGGSGRGLIEVSFR